MRNLWQRRRVFKQLADNARYERTRRFYAQEVYRCDEDIARRLKVLVWTVNILVLVTILCSSCQTVEGFRADIHKLTEPPRTQTQ